MNRIGKAIRLLHISIVLLRHGLDEIIFGTRLFRPVHFLFYLLPWNWFRGTPPPRGVRIRRALADLGPIFVKFGQLLSVRPDVLPEDISEALAELQDRVPPFPGIEARRQIEAVFDASLEEIFLEFDERPLASASIAQVHAARLKNGREVVVKVVRPGIESVIRRDVGLLFSFANLAERYWPEARRLRPRDVVAEYEKIIVDELDMLREAASASQMKRNFADSDLLEVPTVHWAYTRRNVLVMDRIHGIAVNDIDGLRRAGVNFEVLAGRGVEIFFTQVFRHNFFHADMHPGNIFVNVENPEAPRFVAIDFGIMGSLGAEDLRYLAENFMAFFNRDYRRVAELHVQSEWVPRGTRADEFEAAIRTVCEPIFQRPLNEISFGQLLVRLFQTGRRFDMRILPQLILLQKTVLHIEGLGRQLYPELDLWRTARPLFSKWASEQVSGRVLLRGLRDHAPRWGETLPALPGLMHDVLERARDGRLTTEMKSEDLDRLRLEIRRGNRRTFLALIGSALILGAAVVLAVDGLVSRPVAGAPLTTWVLGGLGTYLLLAAWPR